jgi:hypothetical protein
VVQKIGQGGFANVYLVQYSGKEFALKIIELWKFMPTERIEYVARFRQEYGNVNFSLRDDLEPVASAAESWEESEDGKTVTVDIDSAHTGTGGVDTQIFLFNPAGIMVVAGFDTFPYDAGSTPVPGSTLTRDASLQFNLDSTGLWKIAVVAWPARLTDYGAFDMGMSFAIGNGPYTLIVSGLQAAKQHTDIAIDIKPRDPHNAVTIKEKRGQKIRVALLSDKVFDPFVIDDSSLAFGRTGDEKSLVRCAKHGKDLNGDGKRDRVCRFDVTKTGLDHTDNTGILKVTAGGKPFQGSDSIKVIAKKHDNDRRHDSDRRHDDDDDDDDDDD